MSSSKILVQITDHRALITLNRPEKLNALSREMMDELDVALDRIGTDRTVRVVLLTGAGDRAFCVGADIHAWSVLTPLDMWRSWIRDGHRIFEKLARLPQPVIAVLNGYSFGGGLELAMAADLRLAASGVEVAMPEAGLATIPGWGGTQRLSALIGAARAKQMIFTGDRIAAHLAAQWGLLNWVVDPEELMPFAVEVADRIAGNAPIAVQLAKQVIDGGLGQDAAIALESLAGALAATTEDGREGTQAFRERRAPLFTGR